MTALPDDLRTFLAQANPAVIATLRADGAPVTVATWYLLDADGTVLVNMDRSRKRLEHLRKNPRVSLTVLARDDWYTHLSVQGRVRELRDDPDFTDIDRISAHYTGGPYPDHTSGRVSARITIDRYHGWGAQRGADGTVT